MTDMQISMAVWVCIDVQLLLCCYKQLTFFTILCHLKAFGGVALYGTLRNIRIPRADGLPRVTVRERQNLPKARQV